MYSLGDSLSANKEEVRFSQKFAAYVLVAAILFFAYIAQYFEEPQEKEAIHSSKAILAD